LSGRSSWRSAALTEGRAEVGFDSRSHSNLHQYSLADNPSPETIIVC
jgi:hypothetical protein